MNIRCMGFVRFVILGVVATLVGACGDPLRRRRVRLGSGGDGPTGGQGGSSATTATAASAAPAVPVPEAPRTPRFRFSSRRVPTRAALSMSDGTVRCWGTSLLGNGTDDESEAPVEVLGIADAVQVAAGKNVTCVRRRRRPLPAGGSAPSATER